MDTAIFIKKKKQLPAGRTKEVYDNLREDIIKMFPGSVIPSIKQLQNSYSAGQSTVVKAISALEDEGLLIRKPRKGVFVAGNIPETSHLKIPRHSYPSWISVPHDHITFAVPVTSEISLWNSLASAFNSSQPHVPVIMHQITEKEIFLPAAENEMPDMAVFSHPLVTNYPYFNSLDWLDLSPFLNTVNQKDYYPNAFIRDGENRAWGASPYLTTSMIVLNKKVFRECGEDIPGDSWTWEDLFDVSVRLKQKMARKGIRWALVLMGYMNYFFHKGVSFRDAKTEQYIVNTPDMKEAFVFLKRTIVEEKTVPMWSEIRGKHNSLDIVENGLSAMFEEYSYYKEQKNRGFEIGIAPIPVSAGGIRTVSMSPICISSASLNIDDCWEFLKFILSEEGQKIVASSTNSLPARKSVIPEGLSPERLRVQQRAAAEGEIIYRRWPDIFAVRGIIESAFEKWLRFGGNLDELLNETEMVCRWQIEKQQYVVNGK
ncbi:MAG: extracellular solute-binding protein [Candidatus Omnitrophica bacterium]|nr:extracellular solute-binding protein [Candidatus Omnitrophota bacterium]